jgi:hypothetical protein
MTYAQFSRNPGKVLDGLKVGTEVIIERHGIPQATVTGVRTSALPALSIMGCKRTAALRLSVLDGAAWAITRNGMIEAEIRPVRP